MNPRMGRNSGKQNTGKLPSSRHAAKTTGSVGCRQAVDCKAGSIKQVIKVIENVTEKSLKRQCDAMMTSLITQLGVLVNVLTQRAKVVWYVSDIHTYDIFVGFKVSWRKDMSVLKYD